VLINPHEHRHINTAHPTDIRATIFGTSGFHVNQIIPSTVTLGGAHPVFSFIRRVNRDQFPDETFVFRGTDVHLPRGITEATVTGSLTTGQTFSTSTQVFNRNLSYYPHVRVAHELAKEAVHPNRLEYPTATLALKVQQFGGTVVANTPTINSETLTNFALNPNDLTGPVISIKRREPVIAGHRGRPKVPLRIQTSLNRYLRHADGPPGGSAV
jgi:hypothetical protein